MFWWIIATLSAFFVKGLCGFANTLVFTTILSFGNNNINISPVELILGYPTNAILAWKERKSIKWNICILLIILVIVGSIPGILFLKNSNTTVIKVVFGFFIICIGIEMLFREIQSKKIKQSKIVFGIISFQTLRQAIILMPWMFLGLAIGMLSSKFLDDKLVGKLVIIMLIVS